MKPQHADEERKFVAAAIKAVQDAELTYSRERHSAYWNDVMKVMLSQGEYGKEVARYLSGDYIYLVDSKNMKDKSPEILQNLCKVFTEAT